MMTATNNNTEYVPAFLPYGQAIQGTQNYNIANQVEGRQSINKKRRLSHRRTQEVRSII